MRSLRIVPVVILEDADDALPRCDALNTGGLPIAEVTFRTDAAPEVIAHIRRDRPDMLVGAETILTPEQVVQIVDADASFFVTPGFNSKVVNAALNCGVSIIPGVDNSSQVEMAAVYGPRLLEFFPDEASGGRAMLHALSEPYNDVRFVPTGGIGPANLSELLSLDNVVACESPDSRKRVDCRKRFRNGRQIDLLDEGNCWLAPSALRSVKFEGEFTKTHTKGILEHRINEN